MTREEAHDLVDQLFNVEAVSSVVNVPEAPARELPEGQRVVRTKQSGDRVYLLKEDKKTRHWVTNPDVLVGLGFEVSDVTEVDDTELFKYQTAAAIYKVD